VIVDGHGLTGLDTAGALQLHRLLERMPTQSGGVSLTGFAEPHLSLLTLVQGHLASPAASPAQTQPPERPSGLDRLGHRAWEWVQQGFSMLSFGGETALALLRALRHPARLRWRQTLLVVEHDGVRALPVLGMLAFLIGVVIAYQSGVQLRVYGGNLYVVDLVTITVLRELGPMMTAIVVAGRSGSAYAAQIGTMVVTEEVDALRSIGVSPLDLLVLPKVLGLVIALPLLTVFADLMAVFGGLVMSASMLDLSPDTFMRRIPEAISINSVLTGVAKAPVFAVMIAAVGCYQGFQVRDGADSVGRHTTTSVVQAIVWVIVIDAVFSVIYSWLEI
jgi:phospholipid/cholesterol/gamma-HCH transport system permease protein